MKNGLINGEYKKCNLFLIITSIIMKGIKIKEKIIEFKVKTRRDPESFAEFYDIYVERIYRFIYFKVSSNEEAQDLTSEVFLKTWQYLNENNSIDSLKALIYRISRNIVIDFYRKKSQTASFDTEYFLQTLADVSSEKMRNQVHAKVDMQCIEKILLRLKDSYREVIILRYIEEFSIKEISSVLGKPAGSVKVLLHRAMKRVKSLYDEEIKGES